MFRGVDKTQEQDPGKLIRDTRTLGQKVHDFFQEPKNIMIIMVVSAFSLVFFAAVADLIFLIMLGVFLYSITRKPTLPFRMPLRANALDYNDPKPGSGKPNKARGICFFGNEAETNKELWFNNDDMRTHVLIFGSTGSGKTVTLVSLAFNALIQGSGFIYVDGKGDNTLFSQVFSMARRMGREDDVLTVNFMTGARDIIGPQERRLSNTLNPFAKGSSDMLSQLVINLMDSSGGGGDGDMWKGRAISFVQALMKLLVYMRDEGKILLDSNTIRNYFELPRLESIVIDKTFVRDKLEPVSISHIPEMILEPIHNYVINLPGYNKQKKGNQVSQVLEQHGFITMQLTRVFTMLADTYGHILRTDLAEVDLPDVVLNRRILVVLLPALEKSPDELSSLGKVIISTLKAMMASGLGEQVEGSKAEIIDTKPTNAPTPFICIMDEYGYYAVDGFAVVPAQARSLGFSAIFAGQDLPAFQKASKEEAMSIGANTNIKICMKLEDPLETWDFFQKTAGEAYVNRADSFQTNSDSIFNSYTDSKSASSEKRQRIDLMDLKEQREGEFHIFFRSSIIRANSFFANPRIVKYMRLNHFLRVSAPDLPELLEFEQSIEKFKELVESGDFNLGEPPENEVIDYLSEFYDQHQEFESLIEKAVGGVVSFYYKDYEEEEEEEAVFFEDEELTAEDADYLSLFNPVKLHKIAFELMSPSERDKFSNPLLDKFGVIHSLEHIQQLLGGKLNESRSLAKELVKDLNEATRYPPGDVSFVDDKDTVITKIDQLTEYFSELQKQSQQQ